MHHHPPPTPTLPSGCLRSFQIVHTDLTLPTLQAGEITLEGEIARLTMRSMSSAGGLDFLGSLQQVS